MILDRASGRAALYFHVPFCSGKCGYCSFFSRPIAGYRADSILGLVDASLARALSLAERFNVTEFATAYVGGGTPSALPTAALRSLLSGMDRMGGGRGFGEWTVEVNPESLDKEKLGILADAGVNRISLGVQSREPAALSAIGRSVRPLEIEKALDLAAAQWKGRLSVDLIAGLPGQTPGGIASDIDRVVEAGAGHLSIYDLTIEEGTPLADTIREGVLELPSEEKLVDIGQAVQGACDSAGLTRYEVSNWALPGAECLHNLNYWRSGLWIGAGPSAVSSIPLDYGRTLRIEEGRNIPGYIENAETLAQEEDVPPKPAAFETLMMAFRAREGLDARAFQERFGVDVHELFSGSFHRWRDLILLGERGPAPSDRLLDILNPFLVDCLRELEESPAHRFPPSGGLS